MSNRAIRNKDSCLLWCEILYSLIGPCRPFKGSYSLKNKERNFLWNSVYIYQTTWRQMSEGINLCSHHRGNILSHHRLEFHLYLSFCTLFISFFPAFFPFYCFSSFSSSKPVKIYQFRAVHVSNFTWRLKQKESNEISHNPDIKFVNEIGNNIRNWNLKVFN